METTIEKNSWKNRPWLTTKRDAGYRLILLIS